MSSYGCGFNGNDRNLDSERRDPGLTAQKQNKDSIFIRKPSLTPKIVRRIQVLRLLEAQHKKLEKKFFKDRAALVDKYHQLYKPLYEKRYKIVNGITEVGVKTQELLEDDEANGEKGVPNFWLSALKNNKKLLIMNHDECALQYLNDIKWSRIHDPKGFKLEFLFDPNPYFRNSVLTKTYYMVEEHEPIWSKEIGTEIDWYPGQSLTISPRKDPKNVKSMTAADICYSFFTFFKPPQHDDYTGADMVSTFKTRIENDREMGLTIRDKITPHAVSWFAVNIDELDDSEDDDDSDYHFDFDSDDEDDMYKKYAAAYNNNKEEEDRKRKRESDWTQHERAMARLTLREQ
ncbi:nucleosome assembly protein 1,4-like [Rosa sericea]